MPGLVSLPVELLFEVHIYSRSPSLPLVNKFFFATFSRAPALHKADYLDMLHGHEVNRFDRALFYPLCTPEVLAILIRRWPGSTSPLLPSRLFCRLLDEKPKDGCWTNDSFPLPLLRLLSTSNLLKKPSHAGLAYAVGAKFYQLIEFLLKHGSNPRYNSGKVIRVAIAHGDLDLVRLLCEWDGSQATVVEKSLATSMRRRRKNGPPLSDILFLKQAIQLGMKEIAQYFIDQGVKPDMETLRLLDGRATV